MIRNLHKKMLFSAFFASTMLTSKAQQTGLDLDNFSGDVNYVVTTQTGPLGDAPRSIEAWIKCVNTNNQQVIVEYGGGGAGMRFTLKTQNQHVRMEIGGDAMEGSTNIALEWHHVAVTFDPDATNSVQLYVDGEPEPVTYIPFTNTVNTSDQTPIQIGARAANPSPTRFNGTLDEIRIWDVARTPEQILAFFDTELCPADEPNLIHYYKLNDGVAGGENTANTIAVDSAGDNDGTLMNFDLSGEDSNWVATTDNISALINLDVVLDEGVLVSEQVGAAYQWLDADNDYAVIEGETNQTFTPLEDGSYAVEITVAGCSEISETVNLVDGELLGIEDVMFANNLKLYPNPTSGNVNVTLNGVYQTVDAQLVSITGKVVATYQFSNTNEFSLDLNKFNSGLYFLNLKADQLDAATVKVVKM